MFLCPCGFWTQHQLGGKGKAKQETESKSQKIKSAQVFFFITVTDYGKNQEKWTAFTEQSYAVRVCYTQHPRPLLWLHKKSKCSKLQLLPIWLLSHFFMLNYKKRQMGGIKFLHLLHLEYAVSSLYAPPYAACILIPQCRPSARRLGLRLKYNTTVRKKQLVRRQKKWKKPRSKVDGFGGTEHEKNILNGFVAVGKFNEIGKNQHMARNQNHQNWQRKCWHPKGFNLVVCIVLRRIVSAGALLKLRHLHTRRTKTN